MLEDTKIVGGMEQFLQRGSQAQSLLKNVDLGRSEKHIVASYSQGPPGNLFAVKSRTVRLSDCKNLDKSGETHHHTSLPLACQHCMKQEPRQSLVLHTLTPPRMSVPVETLFFSLSAVTIIDALSCMGPIDLFQHKKRNGSRDQ